MGSESSKECTRENDFKDCNGRDVKGRNMFDGNDDGTTYDRSDYVDGSGGNHWKEGREKD